MSFTTTMKKLSEQFQQEQDLLTKGLKIMTKKTEPIAKVPSPVIKKKITHFNQSM